MNTKKLQRLFIRRRVIDMQTLESFCKKRSRRSLFRDLSAIGYLSSYSHTGRFYTLTHIPNFDEYGLWHYQEIHFSKYGTLKSSLCETIGNSVKGFTHGALKQLYQVRVQNTLNDLINEKAIDREKIDGGYIYTHTKSAIAFRQISYREKENNKAQQDRAIDPYVAIEILLEVIHGNNRKPALMAKRLQDRGISVSLDQVKIIFARYHIDSKKNSNLKHSRS